MKLSARFIQPTLNVKISAQKAAASIGTPIVKEYVNADPYEGEYVLTPSDSAQILETFGKRMTDNLVINPIPSNYGRIAWNGVTLTVY